MPVDAPELAHCSFLPSLLPNRTFLQVAKHPQFTPIRSLHRPRSGLSLRPSADPALTPAKSKVQDESVPSSVVTRLGR